MPSHSTTSTVTALEFGLAAPECSATASIPVTVCSRYLNAAGFSPFRHCPNINNDFECLTFSTGTRRLFTALLGASST
ncbi:hypothetical protein C8J56DRAFT_1066052 [Mycena floridula]|nr:hypothetical protein C8J56DRAFT_1066052 [Mycena floridula]